MKKQYNIPELNIVMFDIKDIITHSLATEDGDNIVDVSEDPGTSGWFDFGEDGMINTPWGPV